MLFPFMAAAADWVVLGEIPAAQILLDQQSVQTKGKETRAWLKFIYYQPQAGQNVTRGKSFDSSSNLYLLDCATKRYQVLELVMYAKNEVVGTFYGQYDVNNFDPIKPRTAAMFMFQKVCNA